MFPLRSSVITPTFRPQTWALGEDTVTSTDRAKILEKDVKEVAIKAAAASMALQIGLMFIPVVGWALGAVVALVQYFTGKHYDKRVKEVIAQAADSIRTKAASANTEVTNAASRVYDQEYQSAVTLALSATPLQGLGDFWSSLHDKVQPVARVVQKIVLSVPKATVMVSRLTTENTLKLVADVADKTGHDNFAAKVTKFEQKGSTMAADIQKRSDNPDAVNALLSGAETLTVAQQKIAELKKTAFGEIDQQKNAAIALLQSTQGRDQIRKQTALALRGSPETLARKAQLDEEEARLRASLNIDNANADQAINGMQPTVAVVSSMTKTTALVGTGLAAVAAFLAFR